MRPAQAIIDLAALRHNYAIAKQLHGGQVLAVLKANAYGHGANRCASALTIEADGFAVASIEEALALRAAGISNQILLLEGVFAADELPLVLANKFWMVVHCQEQIDMLAHFPSAAALTIWLKINSGMNRAGLALADADQAVSRVQEITGKKPQVLMTHLARADEPHHPMSAEQCQQLIELSSKYHLPLSLANSAGVLAWPTARQAWGRAGIMLYGADPVSYQPPLQQVQLKPVMTLRSRIIATRTIQAGDSVGYGSRFVAPQVMRIALVAMGYADGYPRNVPDGTPVFVNGKKTSIVGRVSMDMITVDITHLPDAGFASEVEFWGNLLPVNTIAEAAGTIAYELLCNVKRVDFDYINEAVLR